MTVQEQEQKKKSKKSLDELIEELKSITKKMAVVYVPEIAKAVKDEHPDWDIYEKKKYVLDAFVNNGWNEQYIERVIRLYAPELNEENAHHLGTVAGWEKRHLNKLIEASQKFANTTKNIPEPPEPKEKETPIDEDFEYKMQEAQVLEYGDTGKSIRELTGAISKSGYDVIEALSNNRIAPSGRTDFINDYIKKSREFRKGVMLEVDDNRRAELHNILSMVVEIAEDTIEIIEEIDKKK